MTRKQWGFRLLFYSIGVVILAVGITLNTKTGLGVSPLISVPYSIAAINSLNVGNITFVYYCIVTVLQLIIRGKNRNWFDLLQIPFSVVFTRFMNLFSVLLAFTPENIGQQLVILFFAIVCTGIGAAMSVNMKLIANPCDSFVHMAGELSGKGMGFAKNIFDLINVSITFVIGLCAGHLFIGIGLGTVLTVIFTGRVIALFNRIARKKIDELSGMASR